MRFEEGEWFCFGPAEKFEGEGREEFKRHHRGNGISGQAEDGFVLADGEHRWFAGANGDRVEVKVGATIAEDFFDEVVLSRGNAAGEDEHVLLEALRDFVVEILLGVLCIREDDGFAAVERDLRSERVGVAVADLEVAGFGFGGNNFVAGGEDSDAGSAKNLELDFADLRCRGDFGKADSRGAGDQHLAFSRFPAAGDDVLTRLDRLGEDDCVAFGRGVFDHHDGVCTFRDGGAGHDLYAGSRCDGNFGSVAGFEFTDAAEFCAGRDFSGANGETVSDRAVERRVKAIGADFLVERAADGFV